MKQKFRTIKYQISILLVVVIILSIAVGYKLQNAYAQPAPCQAQTINSRAQGLISAPLISQKFSNPSGVCVQGNEAAQASYKIPTYADLLSRYYTQSKATTIESNNNAIYSADIVAGNEIYNYIHAAGVSIPGGITYFYNGVTIIFVNNTLTISDDISNFPASAQSGLVIIAGGNIIIGPTVTQIDAVLVSAGKIYTAGNGCTRSGVSEISPGVPIQKLTINGSLISLTESAPIEFCRYLSDNACLDCAAEVINQQPKYLVILRDLFADTFQKWSEIQ